ncbi:MAG: glycosyltransferase [Endomicrobia bacterium]|nr:glycosyltransferase [Endomicrobiia bacterium]
MKLSVVLPSYKEAENLKNILPALKSALSKTVADFEILAVDTMAAMDSTPAVCKEYGVRYVNRTGGNYYGDAIRTGIKEARGEFTVIIDADGSHPAEKISEMLSIVENGEDLVIGSRYVEGGTTRNGFISKLMSKCVNVAFSAVLGIKIKDMSNSFRMYKTGMLKELELECDNFDIVEEIIVKLFLNNTGLRVKEIPIEFCERAHGESKRSLVKFIISYLSSLFKLKRLQNKAKNDIIEKMREAELEQTERKETPFPGRTAPNSLRRKIASAAVLIVCLAFFFVAAYAAYVLILGKYVNEKYSVPAETSLELTAGKTITAAAHIDKNDKIKEVRFYLDRIEPKNYDSLENCEVVLTVKNAATGSIKGSSAYDCQMINADSKYYIVPINRKGYADLELSVTASESGKLYLMTSNAGSMAYTIVTVPRGIYAVTVFILILCFLAAPLFLYSLFKFGIIDCESFFKKITFTDVAMLSAMLAGFFILFSYDDLDATLQHGYLFLKLFFDGKALDFYKYSSGTGLNAVYAIPTYMVYAFWNLPFFIVEKITGSDIISGTMFRNMSYWAAVWNKILAAVFYAASCRVIYKIGRRLGMNAEKSKWMTFAWAAYPISYFGGFIYGQYDSIGLLFLLISIYYLLNDKKILFAAFLGLSFCFKPFVLLIFLPLLLLKEKRISRAVFYIILALAPNVILGMIFSAGNTFYHTADFLNANIANMSGTGLPGAFGPLSYIGIAMLALTVFCYNCKPYTILQSDRMIIYISLLAMAVFFISASWYTAYWYIFITPFLFIAFFQSQKKFTNSILLLLMVVGFTGTFVAHGTVCFNENLLNYGFLNRVFLSGNILSLKLKDLLLWFGKVPPNVYSTLFAAALAILLIEFAPKKGNLAAYRQNLTDGMPLTKEFTWGGLMLFNLLYVVPALLIYFTV